MIGLSWNWTVGAWMAESEGFEPPDGLTRQQFSRLPHSTTLPALRAAYSIAIEVVCGLRMKFTFLVISGQLTLQLVK